MASPTSELWDAVRGVLIGNTALMSIIDAVYDKAPKDPWKGKNAHIARGPVYGSDDGAECIASSEITLQLDVWSRKPSRLACDDIVFAVKQIVEAATIELPSFGLVEINVVLWRVIDDPDPLQQHGVIQLAAMIDEEVD
ncbi:DUF3168 domain-containing protein [Shinella zoogloeoides]|uniref:DUF3168 domain-containing protein n=1 Tax=Shinella zoogloeoides TaxID=352475 RepID=UPI001F56D6AF|nr:DUF3168 domain-containing protein [Shinella zoogloeoides]